MKETRRERGDLFLEEKKKQMTQKEEAKRRSKEKKRKEKDGLCASEVSSLCYVPRPLRSVVTFCPVRYSAILSCQKPARPRASGSAFCPAVAQCSRAFPLCVASKTWVGRPHTRPHTRRGG